MKLTVTLEDETTALQLVKMVDDECPRSSIHGGLDEFLEAIEHRLPGLVDGSWGDDAETVGVTPEAPRASQSTNLFQVGDIVKVVRDDVYDSEKVFGRIGRVDAIGPGIYGETCTIRFSDGPKSIWQVLPVALELMFRQ